MANTLNLPTSPWTAVFRYVVTKLQADATLAATVKIWKTFDGSANDLANLTPDRLPAVLLWPVPSPADYNTPSSIHRYLQIHYEIVIDGTCADDMLNLFHHALGVLTPTDANAAAAIRQELIAVGSQTGVFTFTPPMIDFRSEPGSGADASADDWLAAAQCTAAGAMVFDIQWPATA